MERIKVGLRFTGLDELEAKVREAQMKLDLARDLLESAKLTLSNLPEISFEMEPSDGSGP